MAGNPKVYDAFALTDTELKKAKALMVKAKSRIILSQPFFATIAMPIPFIEDKRSPFMMWTNGKQIGYNPAYILDYSIDIITGVIIHEIFHIVFLHHIRRGNRNHKRWNYAGDYVINLLVKGMPGIDLPDWVLYDFKYKEKTTDWVYDNLLESGNDNNHDNCVDPSGGDAGSGDGSQPGDENDGQFNSNDSKQLDEVRDMPGKNGGQSSDSERKQEEQTRRVELEQAKNIAKRAGALSAWMERLIDDILEPVINYKDILSRFLDEYTKNGYDWNRPNKRYIQRGLYLPRLRSRTLGEGFILCDMSGSIGGEAISQMAGEIQSILSLWNTEFDVGYFDSVFYPDNIDHITIYDIPVKDSLHPVGGGGTNIIPAFEWINESGEDPRWMIIYTDGYLCSYPDKSHEPNFPVLWLLTEKNETFDPPFGEVIYMKK